MAVGDRIKIITQNDLVSVSNNGLMSNEDKKKLDEISTDANKVEDSVTNGNVKIDGTEINIYTHPNDADTRHVTDVEKTTWNGKAAGSHNHPATQVTAGGLPVGVLATNSTDYTTSRPRNIQASTVDLTPGTSALASGSFYAVFE